MYSKPCMKLFMPSNINRQASQPLSPPVSCRFCVASHVESRVASTHLMIQSWASFQMWSFCCETIAINPELEKSLSN